MTGFAKAMFEALQPIPPAELQRLLTCPDQDFDRFMRERGEPEIILPFPDVRQIEREVGQISL